jgi:hypothetical protein
VKVQEVAVLDVAAGHAAFDANAGAAASPSAANASVSADVRQRRLQPRRPDGPMVIPLFVVVRRARAYVGCTLHHGGALPTGIWGQGIMSAASWPGQDSSATECS